MDLLDWCKRLIATPSVTQDGTRRIAEMCARELLAPLGITAALHPSKLEGPEQVNLVARIDGQHVALKPLVLNTHLDTVPPGDNALWTSCGQSPFSPTLEGERLYGLGAADTKLDFAAKVYALAQVGRPKRTTYLVATFGEERGLKGAKELLASGVLPREGLALVGEPSGLSAITAHKGLMAFQLRCAFAQTPAAGSIRATFRGRAAHSSTPRLGRNAIADALRAVAADPNAAVVAIEGGDAVNKVPASCTVILDSPLLAGAAAEVGFETLSHAQAGTRIPRSLLTALLEFVDELERFADRTGPIEDDYAAPTLTCNPALLRTQPGALSLEFELRPPPSLKLEVVARGVEQLTADLRLRYPSFAIELVQVRGNPGFRSAAGSEVVALALEAMAQAGLPLKVGVKAGCTEAGIYAAAGIEPLVFGPGPSTGVIHAPNEYNLLVEVEGAARFYEKALKL